MADYWKSQGKYWCRFCKIFLQDNPITRNRHDQGPRHKQAVRAHLASIYAAEREKKETERETAAALAEVNANAALAYAKDVLGGEEGPERAAEELRKEVRAQRAQARQLGREKWKAGQEETIRQKLEEMREKGLIRGDSDHGATADAGARIAATIQVVDSREGSLPVSGAEIPRDPNTRLPCSSESDPVPLQAVCSSTPDPSSQVPSEQHPYGAWQPVVQSQPTPAAPQHNQPTLNRKGPRTRVPDLELIIDEEESLDYDSYTVKEKLIKRPTFSESEVSASGPVGFKRRKVKGKDVQRKRQKM